MARKPKGEGPAKAPESEDKRLHEETTEKQLADFRAHYLYSGNASESGRELGINERTARDIARKLSAEPSFAEDRRALRANALEELVAMRKRVADLAYERFAGNGDLPEHIDEGANVTIIDKRPDYGKLVLEAEKNAHNLAKLENPGADSPPTEVHITVSGPGGQVA